MPSYFATVVSPMRDDTISDGCTNLIAYLAKVFQQKEHADFFLSGSLYARRLSWFKKLEGSDGRADEYEGAILPPLDEFVFELEVTDPSTGQVESITITGTDLAAPLVIQPRWFDHINLFCMYAGLTGEFQYVSSENLSDFRSQMEMPEESLQLGPHAVVPFSRTLTNFSNELTPLPNEKVTDSDVVWCNITILKWVLHHYNRT